MEDRKERHGSVKELSYSITHHSMMAGGGSHRSQVIRWDKDRRAVLTDTSSGGGKRSEAEYEIQQEAAEKAARFVFDRDLAGISKIEFPKEVIAFDDVTSSSISVVFDDTETGGLPFVVRRIHSPVAGTYFGELEEAVQNVIDECREAGKMIRFDVTEEPRFGGLWGGIRWPDDQTPEADEEPEPGTWICPACRQRGNTGKFCPECGTPRPVTEGE